MAGRMNSKLSQPSAQRLFKSSLVFSGMTFVSRVFGYLRDAVVMVVFGATGATDAFLVAFRLPNFLRRLFAEGALTQALVPVLAEFKEKRSAAELKALTDRTAGTLGLVLIGITAAGILLAPVLIKIFAPGFTADTPRFELATQMLRITFPYILFISLTALAASILNCFGRFGVPAFTPILLNLSLIAAALWLAPRMESPITALAWGVLIAGIAQLAVQLPFLKRLGLLPRPVPSFRDEGVRRIIRLMSPAVFGASVVQVNLLIDTLIASFLAAGSISWLYIADRFVELPVGLFAVALATVLLPRLSRYYAMRETKQFTAALSWGIRTEWLVALPCLTGLMMLAEPILISLVQYREFTPQDTRMAQIALLAYAAGLPAFMLVKILSAAFFSRQNTRLPVRVAVIAMVANVVMNLLFVFLWQRSGLAGAHAGLAAATSLSAWLNCALLYRALVGEGIVILSGDEGFPLKCIAASVVMGTGLFLLSPDTAEWNSFPIGLRLAALGGLVAAGAGLYALVMFALGVRPAQLAAPEVAEKHKA